MSETRKNKRSNVLLYPMDDEGEAVRFVERIEHGLGKNRKTEVRKFTSHARGSYENQQTPGQELILEKYKERKMSPPQPDDGGALLLNRKTVMDLISQNSFYDYSHATMHIDGNSRVLIFHCGSRVYHFDSERRLDFVEKLVKTPCSME